VAGSAPTEQGQPYVPLSAWAMPADDGEGVTAQATPPEVPTARSFDGFPDDQDAIDTTPNRILGAADLAVSDPPDAGFEEDLEVDDDDVEAAEAVDPVAVDRAAEPVDDEAASGPPSGRHAAIQLDEPDLAQTSLRLASGDGPPDGYPIKADTATGRYWLPGSEEYDGVVAEIWFASEEFALTNGFVRG
jgi:hypothetical protein